MASSERDEEGLPEICEGTTASVRQGNVRLGLLDSQKCAKPLEYGMDD